MNSRHGAAFLGLLFIGLLSLDLAADSPDSGPAESLVRTSCAECHTLDASERETSGFSQRAERRGPPLDFAGNKFRREWLVDWLQAPTRLRPAGVYPPSVVVADDAGKDQVDTSLLTEHPALSAEDAVEVADVLMEFRSRDSLVDGLEIAPPKVPRKMGELNFGKFKGCIACHIDQPGRGGVSGPELTTAWRRATPEYLFSYISDPTAWDRHTLMPRKALNDSEVEKLLGYLRLLSEENE